MQGSDAVPLSAGLLVLMREAARAARDAGEPAITLRALVAAMVADAMLGANLANVAVPTAAEGASPLLPERTLWFKTPDGDANVPLDERVLRVFLDGANRARERYTRKDAALSLAAMLSKTPAAAAALGIAAGPFAEAVSVISPDRDT